MKLTLAPGEVDVTDLIPLRESGFDDDALTIAVQVIGYFNYINRIADGLGVDAESWMEPAPEEWRAKKGTRYEEVFRG